MNDKMTCKILSPAGEIYSGEVSAITLPAYDGEMQIRPHHSEAFIELKPGDLKIFTGMGQPKTTHIPDAICWFYNNTINILTSNNDVSNTSQKSQ